MADGRRLTVLPAAVMLLALPFAIKQYAICVLDIIFMHGTPRRRPSQPFGCVRRLCRDPLYLSLPQVLVGKASQFAAGLMADFAAALEPTTGSVVYTWCVLRFCDRLLLCELSAPWW